MSAELVKLCVDCRWYQADENHPPADRCLSPSNVAAHELVRGAHAWHWIFCKQARAIGPTITNPVCSPGCGPDAAWFEPKESPS